MTIPLPGYEDTYNVAEVAASFNVNEQTVRNWIKSGALRAAKIGRGWVITRRDLQSFVATKFGLEPGDLPGTGPQTTAEVQDGGPEEPRGL